MKTSNALKAWRRRYQLTQAAAAAALGVTLRTFQRWEAGHHKPLGLAAELLKTKLQNPPEL